MFLISFLILLWVFWRSFAAKYIYFYGDGCPHCEHIKEYFKENNLEKTLDIHKKEVWKNKANSIVFAEYAKSLWLQAHEIGVPFMVIMKDTGTLDYKIWDTPIIEHLEAVLAGTVDWENPTTTMPSEEWYPTPDTPNTTDTKSKISLFITLLTTSLADSINPCVFAVMLLLLSTILGRSKSRKKAVFAGLMFVLAIFLGYTLLGKLLLWLLTTVGLDGSGTGYWIQMTVGILWILIGLANLKDYFFPDLFPPMEVPISRRPKMQKIVKGVLSPWGAFGIGIILTAFLLPCTAGPYVTFTMHLSSYPDIMNSSWAYYLYLIIYNIIFIIPMLLIVLVIGLGFKSVEELWILRKKYRTIIHLIVGLLMLGLWIYILLNIL